MKHSNGNALFLILIAVALFAALSYAVTNSGRGGSGIDKEQAAIAASQIFQAFASFDTAYQRMKIINGCKDTEVSFERAPFDSSDVNMENTSSPSNFSCHFYHSDGGSVAEFALSDDWIDFTGNLSGSTASFGVVNPTGGNSYVGVGTGAMDQLGSIDLALMSFGINDAVCQEINNRIGVNSIPDNGANYSPNAVWTGSYSIAGQLSLIHI